MIAEVYTTGEKVREGDIFRYKAESEEHTVASFSDFLSHYPEERTDKTWSYIPYIDEHGSMDGLDINVVVFVRRADGTTDGEWTTVAVGDKVTLVQGIESHTFVVVDYYDDEKDGRVLSSRFHSYAQNDGWKL